MSLRRTVACAAALGIAAAPASIAPALAAPTFPATASATLVGLAVAPDAGGAEGLWGTVYVSSEVGEERLEADTASDPGGLLEPVSAVGPVQATVNTTARGGGRAEAVAELGGLTLSLPGIDTPAVEVGPLRNSLTCDFSGNLEWEGGPGDERVVTVFGTPLTPSGGEASADVELPDGRTAEVTVTDHAPAGEDGDGGAGEMYTGVRASVDGAELFDLAMAAVSVECPTDGGGTADAPAAGERDDGEPTDGPTTREDDASPSASPGAEGPAAGAPDEGTDPAAPSPTATSAPAADDGDTGIGDLPITGAALAGLVTAGVLAVGGGAAAVYLARRRSRDGDGGTSGPGDPAA